MNRKNSPKTVYIHIPFCAHRCFYCDFNTYVVKGQPVQQYLETLEREMELTVLKTPPQEIATIFVGGGTPTVLLPAQMEYFLQMVNTYFPKRSVDFEFTMEANPGTTDLDKLAVMKEGGVNRISFGVQSFDNQLLSAIGRIHNTDDVYRSIDNARSLGFQNLSIDLMFGLPNQTLAQLEESLTAALAIDLQHYSIYGLKVEENTVFHKLYQKNELPLPEEDVEVAMYQLIMQRLESAGYHQYEISNFAKPGYESRHNTAYWRNWDYYGLGAGAHGYIDRTRHMNARGIQEYITAVGKGLPVVESSQVSTEEAMEDFMMVGLRLLDGVHNADFAAQFGRNIDDCFGEIAEPLVAKGLLEATDDGYRLSKSGILLGNEVFAEFIGVLVG